MSFASSQTIKAARESWISPFNPQNVKHGAYELTVGSELVSTKDGKLVHLDPGDTEANWPYGRTARIEPGQLAMLITAETVRIPKDRIGLISIKASAKLAGLVNVSGFHVDPGFEGRLKFTVYNAGSIAVTLRRDQRLFMIWFASFDESVADPYNGSHDHQKQIESRDISNFQGELPSPIVLEKRINKVEEGLRVVMAIVIAITAVILTGRIPGCGT